MALPANARRGRQVLAWALGVFLAAQLTAGLLFDYRWPQIRFPSAFLALSRMKSDRQGGADIVLMGSSRFGSIFLVDVIQPRLRRQSGDQKVQVANASVPAGDGYAFEHVLKQGLRAGCRPALVVLEIAPENLGVRNYFMGLHVQRQIVWHDLPGMLKEAVICGQALRLLRTLALPLYAHRREVWRDFWDWASRTPALVERVSDTEAPEPAHTTKHSAAERQRAQRGSSLFIGKRLVDYRPAEGVAAKALERIVKRCTDCGIEVILVAPPVCSQQRQQYTPSVNATFLEYVQHLTQRYGCRFMDCRDRIPDDLLEDNQHASLAGGWEFSRWWNDTVLTPYWQEHRRQTTSTPAAVSCRP